jgi:hypothetical protein
VFLSADRLPWRRGSRFETARSAATDAETAPRAKMFQAYNIADAVGLASRAGDDSLAL